MGDLDRRDSCSWNRGGLVECAWWSYGLCVGRQVRAIGLLVLLGFFY